MSIFFFKRNMSRSVAQMLRSQVNIEHFLLPILNWVSKSVQLFVENKSQLALKNYVAGPSR
jgi:hypothetical protein